MQDYLESEVSNVYIYDALNLSRSLYSCYATFICNEFSKVQLFRLISKQYFSISSFIVQATKVKSHRLKKDNI